ncbi:MAG TPA: urea ABC transporter ATP-binding subunit UrtE [Burkholderiaceae bacterium]|nr:urea ABC transporter ATP-binding subunit UrtE [Burkholderiaceae bacterium]HQR75743.1 urea ABC transporter ATP-binding subunit UrtE [Burkholderiaceae bacterium]
MLTINSLNQYYGGSHILRDVSLEVRAAACTVLLGRNGVGKTTLLKTIMGLVAARDGSLRFDGQDLLRLPPYQRVRAGIGYVPQGREIFNRLTVEENLMMGLAPLSGAAARRVPEHIFELFPVLKQMLKRRGGDLSGGQQQQLAIGRALAADPKLLILDEPTEGIQPSIIKEIGAVIRKLVTEKKMAVLLVEQYYDFAESLADAYAVMSRGQITHRGSGHQMKEDNVVGLLAI